MLVERWGSRRALMFGAAALAAFALAAPTAAQPGDGAAGSRTRVVSVSTDGDLGNWSSWGAKISADGRMVVFESGASNLVDRPVSDKGNLYRHNLDTGVTRLVSVRRNGQPGRAGSGPSMSVSRSGRYVAFTSVYPFVPGDTNDDQDVYVRDMRLHTTTWVTVPTGGPQFERSGTNPSISAGGRYVAFMSVSRMATDPTWNVFVRDMKRGTTGLVSRNSSGIRGNWDSYDPAISADGRYVAFTSTASNLIYADTNGLGDIFVRDRRTGTTRRISVSTVGAQTEVGDSYYPSISGDGTKVAFVSPDPGLVDADPAGTEDAFVHDRVSGVTTRVATISTGRTYRTPTISGDGRYLAFWSALDGLLPEDTNGYPDVFITNLATGALALVSVGASGTPADGETSDVAISANGRHVAFTSAADNLVPGDTNQREDVFVRDLPFG